MTPPPAPTRCVSAGRLRSQSTSRSRNSRSSPSRPYEGEISAENVAGPFTVKVVPTDAFGNPSLRIDNNTGAKDYTSVSFTFASSNAAVTVPSGQQMVTSLEGSTFGAVAADVGGNADGQRQDDC